MSKRAETLVPCKFFFSFLAARCASRRVLFFSSEVILQSLTMWFWLQSGFRQSETLGFPPLPEFGHGEEYKRVFFSPSVPWHGCSLAMISTHEEGDSSRRLRIHQEVGKTKEVVLEVVLLQPKSVFTRDLKTGGWKTPTRCLMAAFGAFSTNVQPRRSHSSR